MDSQKPTDTPEINVKTGQQTTCGKAIGLPVGRSAHTKGAKTEQSRKRLEEGKSLGGAPRTKTPAKWTKAQLHKIDKMAEAQCKDTTIAEVLGVEVETFRTEFSERTRQKRAIGKAAILQKQYEGCKKTGKGAVTERVWFGKQHLEQSDKQQVDANVNVRSLADIAAVMRGSGHHAGE